MARDGSGPGNGGGPNGGSGRFGPARAKAARGEATTATLPLPHSPEQRDTAAVERDRRAIQRSHADTVADAEAAERDRRDELADQSTRSIETLRAHAREARRRAALSRERAAAARAQAAADREQAAADREQAACDRQLAGTDELTAVRRRGVGLEELAREIERVRRTGEELVAAFVDVDGLKAVNDRYGHLEGDALLRDVAAGLRAHMRSYDLIVRLGGDEFLCALPGVSLEEARQRFDALNSELPNGTTPRSVSIGYTVLRDDDDVDDLIDRADRALLTVRSR